MFYYRAFCMGYGWCHRWDKKCSAILEEGFPQIGGWGEVGILQFGG